MGYRRRRRNTRCQHSGGSISARRTQNMSRIKKNWPGCIVKNARGSHFDERAARLRASRVVAEGWMMRANSRGVIFQSRLYRLWLFAIRPADSNAWPNERSVRCDWSGYRIIFRIPLRASFFARYKRPSIADRHWYLRIVMFIKFILILFQSLSPRLAKRKGICYLFFTSDLKYMQLCIFVRRGLKHASFKFNRTRINVYLFKIV